MIRAVVFDLDGTVVETPYDWPEIKRRLETGGTPILTHLENLPEPERAAKYALLEDYEDEATRAAELRDEIPELLRELEAAGVRTALVTNNSSKSTEAILKKFQIVFDCVITRDSGLWKPSGAPLAAALEILGVRPEDSCAVGDSLLDVQAAREAGLPKVYVLGDRPAPVDGQRVERLSSVAELRLRLRDEIGDRGERR